MSQAPHPHPLPDEHPAPPPPRRSFLGRFGLTVAILMMIVGIAWPLLHREPPPAPTALASPLTAEPGMLDGAVQSAKRVWASGLFKFGLSFAAAYIFCRALRGFFNFTVASLAFFVAAIVGLQYAGVMTVTWHAGTEQFDSFFGWLGHQFSSLRQFITGALPSGFAAAVGGWAGWRR